MEATDVGVDGVDGIALLDDGCEANEGVLADGDGRCGIGGVDEARAELRVEHLVRCEECAVGAVVPRVGVAEEFVVHLVAELRWKTAQEVLLGGRRGGHVSCVVGIRRGRHVRRVGDVWSGRHSDRSVDTEGGHGPRK